MAHAHGTQTPPIPLPLTSSCQPAGDTSPEPSNLNRLQLKLAELQHGVLPTLSSSPESTYGSPLSHSIHRASDEETQARSDSLGSWATELGSYTPPSSFTPSVILYGSPRSTDKGKGKARDEAWGTRQVDERQGSSRDVEQQVSSVVEGEAEDSTVEEGERAQPSAGSEANADERAEQSRDAFATTPEADSLCTTPSPTTPPPTSYTASSSSSGAAGTSSPNPSAHRPHLFSFPRTSRRLVVSSSVPSFLSAEPSERTPGRFARSSSSVSIPSRPHSFLSITRTRNTAMSTRTSPDRGRERSSGEGWNGKGKDVLEQVWQFRRSGANKALEGEAQAETTPKLRLWSFSAPLLQPSIPFFPPSPNGNPASYPHSPFVTALSSPVTEFPPTLGSPFDLNLDLFDFLLPREMRIRILGTLVQLCVEEHEKNVEEGRWKGDAARERWVGEVKGRRELVRVGQVSRSWLALAYDGQLWSSIPTTLIGADVLFSPALLRLVGEAGMFVRELDLKGMANLQGETLVEIVELAGSCSRGETAFTVLELTGCSSLTTASLSYLLEHSPHLTTVSLFALRCVVSSTIQMLGAVTAHLCSLNVSRCPNLNATALLHLPSSSTAIDDGDSPRGLLVLRAAKLRLFTDQVLVDLVARHPSLQVLDISHNTHLTDEGFQSLVTVGSSAIHLTSDPPPHRRLLTIRHLILTGCMNLTDRSLHHLTHIVPQLEILELAHMGPLLHSEGLVRLLPTTPLIRSLDLEDNPSLTDAVLLAISSPSRLTHLVVTSCRSLTSTALSTLLQRSPELRTLEADGTAITEATAKEFVTAARARVGGTGGGGAVLSLLDDRLISRRMHKELTGQTRPRTGQRGYWTIPFAYHDEDDADLGGGGRGGKFKALEEYNEERVVVRSFYSNLAVDAANALRESRRRGSSSGLMDRTRTLGELARRSSRGDNRGDEHRGSCVVS